jgi:hypothetical protein
MQVEERESKKKKVIFLNPQIFSEQSWDKVTTIIAES